MDEEQKQKILEEYASNNMAKLRKISYLQMTSGTVGHKNKKKKL